MSRLAPTFADESKRHRPALRADASVAALVPHYRCEQWLADCLESLVTQTRPLQAIIVINDGPEDPPVRIVSRFPSVTLLAAAEHCGGPYRLIQEVISQTRFDAYLFADADDWSAPQRLEILLREAERAGADLIGSQEVRVVSDETRIVPWHYALDVNAALAKRPAGHELLHPTSLVSRDLVRRVGGFATGMRFSGDTEFARRAAYVGRVINVPDYLYFRRKRKGALTTSAETGFSSPARMRVLEILRDRALANAAHVAQGEPPDLSPYSVAPPIELVHIAGPELTTKEERAPRGKRSSSPRARQPTVTTSAGPIFLIGAPYAGTDLLLWSLGQHPNIRPVPHAGWLGALAAALDQVYSSVGRASGPSPEHVMPVSAMAFAEHFGAAAAELLRRDAPGSTLCLAAPGSEAYVWGLLRLFPQARFIHVVHDPRAAANLLAAPFALTQWLDAARACVQAERALGVGRILRIMRDDLLNEPEVVLRRCLAFVEQPFSDRCLWPLSSIRAAGATPEGEEATATVGELDPKLWAEAKAFYDEVLLPSVAPGDPDPKGEANLQRLFRDRAHKDLGVGAVSVADRVRQVVQLTTRPDATVIVVSKGDDALVDLDGRSGWHFPRQPDGAYAGYHPAHAEAAIEHLNQLRAAGGEYLVFPQPAFWWLSHYAGLKAHLSRHPVVWRDQHVVIYDLTSHVLSQE